MAGIGEALRSTRERRGLSIDQVAQETRISPRFLEALETEQFQDLPAPVYVRGFLRSYANYLHLDPQALLDELGSSNTSTAVSRGAYVGSNGHSGRSARRGGDPFRRGGVVAAPAAHAPKPVAGEPPGLAAPLIDDSWAPEPLAPIAPPHEDHGYIPGSDLMEAPEYAGDYEDDEPQVYAAPQPRFERRTAGVLAERPPSGGEPGIPRRVALFGAGVVAVLAFLGLAVLLTRDDDEGSSSASASGSETPGVTPGTIISGAGATATAANRTPGASASPSASATVTGTTTPGASATPITPTPGTTTQAGATTQATQTPTPGATNTPAPTATPTLAPVATPTAVVIRPESNGFGECEPTGTGSYTCGNAPYRVICYAPLGYPQNQNWWVDADRSFGALPPGWKEYDGLLSNGQIINAGQTLCATQ